MIGFIVIIATTFLIFNDRVQRRAKRVRCNYWLGSKSVPDTFSAP
jgi:hypothetical protein